MGNKIPQGIPPSTLLKDLPTGTRLKFDFPGDVCPNGDYYQKGRQVGGLKLPPLDKGKSHCTLFIDRVGGVCLKELTSTNMIRRLKYTYSIEKTGPYDNEGRVWFIYKKDDKGKWKLTRSDDKEKARAINGSFDVNDVTFDLFGKQGKHSSYGGIIFCSADLSWSHVSSTDPLKNMKEPTVQDLIGSFGRYLVGIVPHKSAE